MDPKDRVLMMLNCTDSVRSNDSIAGPVSTVGSAPSLVFGSLQVRFLGPAHSFTCCQLLDEH